MKKNEKTKSAPRNLILSLVFLVTALLFISSNKSRSHADEYRQTRNQINAKQKNRQKKLSQEELRRQREKQIRLEQTRAYNKKLNNMLYEAHETKNLADKKAMQKFKLALSREIHNYRPPINKIISQMTSMSATKDLCWAMVKDYIDKTAKTQILLNEKMKPLREECVKTQKNTEASLRILKTDLQANFNIMVAAIGNDLQTLNNNPHLPDYLRCDLDEKMARVEQLTNDISRETGLAIIGLSLDATWFLPFARKALQSALGGIVRSAASRMSVGGILAILDGPFPFGDAIAGALALYTGYELYDARVNMKNKLSSNLNSASADFKIMLQKEAQNNAENILELSQRLTHETLTNTKKSFLKKNQ